MSIAVSQNKRVRPATGQAPHVTMRLTPELTAALDRNLADDATAKSRSDLIRRALVEHLRAKGYLAHEEPGPASE